MRCVCGWVESLGEQNAFAQVADFTGPAQAADLERPARAGRHRERPLADLEAIVRPGGVGPQDEQLVGLHDVLDDRRGQLHRRHAAGAQLSDRPGRKLEDARAFVGEGVTERDRGGARIEPNLNRLAQSRRAFDRADQPNAEARDRGGVGRDGMGCDGGQRQARRIGHAALGRLRSEPEPVPAEQLEQPVTGVPADLRRLRQEVWLASQAEADDARPATCQHLHPAVGALQTARGAAVVVARDSGQSVCRRHLRAHRKTTSTLTVAVAIAGSGTTSPAIATPSTTNETALPVPSRRTSIS